MPHLTAIFIIFFLFFSPFSYAKTSVWQAQRGEQIIYLGGTIHLLKASDPAIPKEFNDVYAKADALIFEMDLNELNHPALQKNIAELHQLSSGTIKDLISTETWKKLDDYFSAKGFPITNIQNLKAGFIAINMTMLELHHQGFTQMGIDHHFYERANADNKPRHFLETAIQQLTFLANMGVGHEDEFLRYSLQDIQTMQDEITPLVDAWRSGDMAQLERLSLSSMKSKFPLVYQELIVKRNANWLTQLLQYAETPEVEFVLGGVLHFPGKDGILHLLKSNGFTITPVEL